LRREFGIGIIERKPRIVHCVVRLEPGEDLLIARVLTCPVKTRCRVDDA
jgi:hypothetical protein